MTSVQYWESDPWLTAAYREANRILAQRKSEELWLQGLYNYHAFAVSVGNILAKKGAKKLKYLDEPLRVVPLSEEEKERRVEKERQKVIAFFDRLAKHSGQTQIE